MLQPKVAGGPTASNRLSEHGHPVVAQSQFAQNGEAPVGGHVVDTDYFYMIERLAHQAFYTTSDTFFSVCRRV